MDPVPGLDGQNKPICKALHLDDTRDENQERILAKLRRHPRVSARNNTVTSHAGASRRHRPTKGRRQ